MGNTNTRVCCCGGRLEVPKVKAPVLDEPSLFDTSSTVQFDNDTSQFEEEPDCAGGDNGVSVVDNDDMEGSFVLVDDSLNNSEMRNNEKTNTNHKRATSNPVIGDIQIGGNHSVIVEQNPSREAPEVSRPESNTVADKESVVSGNNIDEGKGGGGGGGVGGETNNESQDETVNIEEEHQPGSAPSSGGIVKLVEQNDDAAHSSDDGIVEEPQVVSADVRTDQQPLETDEQPPPVAKLDSNEIEETIEQKPQETAISATTVTTAQDSLGPRRPKFTFSTTTDDKVNAKVDGQSEASPSKEVNRSPSKPKFSFAIVVKDADDSPSLDSQARVKKSAPPASSSGILQIVSDIPSQVTNVSSLGDLGVTVVEDTSTKAQVLKASGGEDMEYDRLSKMDLLAWARNRTMGYDHISGIQNFSTHWSNGMAFCAVIHSYHPRLIKYSSLHPSNADSNLELAFSVADDHFDVPRLLEVYEMKGDLDEDMIQTYVEQLYHTFTLS